ncbi:MAG TPA: T9SS type A sorting domain-containing protein [Rubricoccaceae bacterium]|jgi:hypothetical protein|nr:T9SS type A sorting domain-containing protein [Rubricoccaceae bacterium]
MRLAPSLLFLLLAAPALAQDPVPDTTAAWRYFPLQIGNVWEYDEAWWLYPAFYRYVSIEEVVADTLIENEVYFVIETTRVQTVPEPLPPEIYFDFVRFDTLASTLVWRNPRPLWGGCRFDEDFPADPEVGREIKCPLDDLTGVLLYGGYNQLVEIDDDVVATAVKDYHRSFHGVWLNTRFGANIGLIYESSGEGHSVDRTLRYARVGGVEYGEPSGVANEPDVPGSGLAVTAYPNPSRSSVTLDLAAPSPQAAMVEVFDALGRRVYAGAHAVNGAARVRLDASRWAPGVYVVRATAEDGARATARVVRQ